MGQAFDGDGNVLGEAYGNTKQEVFDKLNAEFKDAAEIRIKSIVDREKAGGSATSDQGDGATGGESQPEDETTGAPV